MLLAAGADPNLQMVPEAEDGEAGYSAIAFAARGGHVRVVAWLLRARAHADLAAASGANAISLARDGGHDEVAEP